MKFIFILLAAMGAQGARKVETPIAQYKNLAVYPIFEPLGNVRDSDYITLDEGLKAGTVTVSERGEANPIIRRAPHQGTPPIQRPEPVQQDYQQGASVNTLWLTNKSGKRLILISGEMVRGGQQDRIIGKDAIIPPTKAPIDLGVYCVEHGRWTGSQTFQEAPASAALVAPNIRKSAIYANSQQAVWNGVAGMGGAARVTSPSSAYRDVAADKGVSRQVQEYVTAIDSRFSGDRAMGVAVAVNGKLVWVDRFSSNLMFRKYWPKLLRSYVMEAVTQQERTPDKAPSWADAMNFVHERDGKTSYEVSAEKSKLTKIESKEYVIFRLEDLAVRPSAAVHESKVVKD